MPEPAVDAARTLSAVRYAGAAVAFAAGSIVRGEGTPHSDLDLVVIYETLDHAYHSRPATELPTPNRRPNCPLPTANRNCPLPTANQTANCQLQTVNCA